MSLLVIYFIFLVVNFNYSPIFLFILLVLYMPRSRRSGSSDSSSVITKRGFSEYPLQRVNSVLSHEARSQKRRFKRRFRKRSRKERSRERSIRYNRFYFAQEFPNGGPVREPLPYFYKFLAPQPASVIPWPDGFPGIDVNGHPEIIS